MKSSFFFILYLSIFSFQNPLFGQDKNHRSDFSWYTDFEEAIKDADANGKNVMLYFSGSDWCKPCIQLNKNILETEIFSDYAVRKLVPIKLDFPKMKKNRLSKKVSSHNESIAEKYNPNGVFPLLVFLDKNEEIIGFTGYSDVSPGIFVSIIERIIDQ